MTTSKGGSGWAAADALNIIAALAIAAILHFALAAQSLWLDEIASAKLAELPLAQLWSDWMHNETNPPLYYTLLGGWTHLAGASDAALRALSLLMGGVTVVLAYVIVRDIAGRRGALFAAVLIACAPEHLHYSQEIRGYALGEAAALTAIWGFLKFCQAPSSGTRRGCGLALYVAGCTAALYTHATLVLLPLILGLMVLVQVWSRRLGWRDVLHWAAASLVVLLMWQWWLTVMWWQIQYAPNLSWLGKPGVGQAVHDTLAAYVPQGALPLKLAALLIIGAAGSLGAWTLRARPALVLPACALLVPLALFVISQKVPVLLPRTIYWASAPLLMTVGIGLARFPVRAGWAGFGVLALLELTAAVQTYARPSGDSWKAVAQAIAATAPDATVIAGGPHVAYSLERYCAAPRCRLRIHTVTPPTETWTSGMPRPAPIGAGQAASVAPAQEVGAGTIYTVVRYGKQAPYAALERDFAAQDLSKSIGLGDEIRVIRWTRKAGAAK